MRLSRQRKGQSWEDLRRLGAEVVPRLVLHQGHSTVTCQLSLLAIPNFWKMDTSMSAAPGQ